MRKHTSGIMPIFALVTATIASAPGMISGQELTADASRMVAAIPATSAEVAFDNASEWKAYASRLADEAEVLPAGSVEALQKIRTAAMIRFNFGEASLALNLMVDAAEAAARSGSVALAAHAYIDGAWIAMAMNRPARAEELAKSAVMLSISPMMNDMDRVAVLRRVERSVPMELTAG